jgi:hypothetical protein
MAHNPVITASRASVPEILTVPITALRSVVNTYLSHLVAAYTSQEYYVNVALNNTSAPYTHGLLITEADAANIAVNAFSAAYLSTLPSAQASARKIALDQQTSSETIAGTPPRIRVTSHLSGISERTASSTANPPRNQEKFIPLDATISYELEYDARLRGYKLSSAGFQISGQDCALVKDLIFAGPEVSRAGIQMGIEARGKAATALAERAQNKSLYTLAFEAEVTSSIEAFKVETLNTLFTPSPTSDPASDKNKLLSIIALQEEFARELAAIKYKYKDQDLTNSSLLAAYRAEADAYRVRTLEKIQSIRTSNLAPSAAHATHAVEFFTVIDKLKSENFATKAQADISKALEEYYRVVINNPDRTLATYYLRQPTHTKILDAVIEQVTIRTPLIQDIMNARNQAAFTTAFKDLQQQLLADNTLLKTVFNSGTFNSSELLARLQQRVDAAARRCGIRSEDMAQFRLTTTAPSSSTDQVRAAICATFVAASAVAPSTGETSPRSTLQRSRSSLRYPHRTYLRSESSSGSITAPSDRASTLSSASISTDRTPVVPKSESTSATKTPDSNNDAATKSAATFTASPAPTAYPHSYLSPNRFDLWSVLSSIFSCFTSLWGSRSHTTTNPKTTSPSGSTTFAGALGATGASAGSSSTADGLSTTRSPS